VRRQPPAGEAARPVAIDLASDATRAEVLRRAVGCGAVVMLGAAGVAVLAPGAGTAQSGGADVEILNFALSLERLQAAFYARAVDEGAIDGDPLEFARVAAEHEAAHVEALVAILGADAADEPELDFGDATSSPEAFFRAAVGLEDLGVAAYNGQAANLTPRALATTAGIASVDARHAAWIRSLAGRVPAAKPVDAGRPAGEIEAAVAATGFVVRP
jgi:hypothetical protein